MTAVEFIETSQRRSPVLGIVAFAVALGLHMAAFATLMLPSLIDPYAAYEPSAFSSLLIDWLPVLGVVGLVLGLLATYLGRGRLWGIAAISIAIAGNSYVHSGLTSLSILVFRAILGTPEYMY